jgi:hypothetical protein
VSAGAPPSSGLEFGPVSVAGASEFVDWTLALIGELRSLMAAGEVTPIPSFDDMLAVFDRVLGQLDQQIRSARARDAATIAKVVVPMTVAEHRLLRDVGHAIESYVGILATRGVVNMDLSPDVGECMTALVAGAYVTVP